MNIPIFFWWVLYLEVFQFVYHCTCYNSYRSIVFAYVEYLGLLHYDYSFFWQKEGSDLEVASYIMVLMENLAKNKQPGRERDETEGDYFCSKSLGPE